LLETKHPLNAYFASDFHLGIPNFEKSLEREQKIVRWLDHVAKDADCIFLMGDVFDFWFEYKYVVPKHFTRLLGKIGTLVDQGIKIYFFKGNHDMWTFDYLSKELGVEVISDELELTMDGKRFFLHHGDGLGPGDSFYKLLRRFFRNPICQRLFAMLPSRIGMGIANRWSRKSRLMGVEKEQFTEIGNEWLYQFCLEKHTKEPFDYYVFGHRHLTLDYPVGNNGRYINLGQWVSDSHYAHFNGTNLVLIPFE
jgi:UDP-2,3-diacylglucosamine hydrolase